MAEKDVELEETIAENADVVANEEGKKKKKRNKYAFLEKHPILYVLVHMVWSFVCIEIIFIAVLGSVFKGIGLNEYLAAVVGGIVYLACHAKRYKPGYKGNFKGGNTALGFRLAAFMGIYWVYLLIQVFAWGEYTNPTFTSVSMALMAGVCEEVVFRLVPVSCLMRQWNDEKKVPVVLAISAVSFGLIHASNIASGAGLAITIGQVVCTGLMGILFCAVYLRSGNILPSILMHAITDFICFLDKSQVSQTGIMTASSITFVNVIDFMVTVCLAVIGIYLIRPAKRAEIIAVWDKKFSKNE